MQQWHNVYLAQWFAWLYVRPYSHRTRTVQSTQSSPIPAQRSPRFLVVSLQLPKLDKTGSNTIILWWQTKLAHTFPLSSLKSFQNTFSRSACRCSSSISSPHLWVQSFSLWDRWLSFFPTRGTKMIPNALHKTNIFGNTALNNYSINTTPVWVLCRYVPSGSCFLES